MSRARIVTDSSAELTPEVVRELDIVLVPWRLQLGTETVQDGPTYRSADFYRDSIRRKLLPAPLPPDVRHFAQVYGGLCPDTDQIVSIHCSGHLNKVVQAANEARSRFLGRCDIHVVDSQFISRALGVLVEAAGRAAAEGLSASEIVRMVNGLISGVYFAFHVEKTDYLGRAGLVADERHTGTGLSRVLLMVEDGRVISFHRSRSRGSPVDRLMDFVVEFRKLSALYITHTRLTTGYRDMAARLNEELPEQPFTEHVLGPITYAYFGPTALGVVAVEG